MPSAHRSLRGSIAEFFAVDDDWERPTPPVGWFDIALGVGIAVFGVLTLEFARSVQVLNVGGRPLWLQWLAVVSGSLLLIWRRRNPVLVGILAATHMFALGLVMPVIMGQFALQVVYFSAIYSAVAWARSRRTAMLVAGGVTVFMLLWVAWQLALGSGIQELLDEAERQGVDGPFNPAVAGVAISLLVNLVYFGGAIIIGQLAWRGARQRARLEEQSKTIAAQADSLRRRAVVDERLRIARELHDVVGHHVAVIGVQAGAARRVIDKRPEAAADALGRIEVSSRDAVTQMRSLLGTLRDIERAGEADSTSDPTSAGPVSDRAPEPGLADLATLVAERDDRGERTAYAIVETRPGLSADVPTSISLSLYRIVQEALANVSRHSSATHTDVVLRVEAAASTSYVEVEVTDNGRTRFGTSGSGMGQLGMRERAASHHGSVDIGPRPTGGYRVRVRIPLGEES